MAVAIRLDRENLKGGFWKLNGDQVSVFMREAQGTRILGVIRTLWGQRVCRAGC